MLSFVSGNEFKLRKFFVFFSLKTIFFSPQISLLCDEVTVEWNSNDFYDFSRTFSSRNFFLLLLQVESYKNNSCNNSNHSLECLTYIYKYEFIMDEFFIVSISNSLLYETLLYKEGKKNLRKILFHYFNSLLNSFPPYIVILFWKALERKKKTIKNSITK